MALPAGTRIGPYEVIGQIGAGGMGEVYRATDTRLKREVALKILPESFATDAERLARFQREAEVLASLNHPNIAHVHGLERSDGVQALVMELVDGATLAGPLPLERALLFARQILSALTAAHDKGITHRDLKPGNILVTAQGIKLLDFGLAKLGTDLQAATTGQDPGRCAVGVANGGTAADRRAHDSGDGAVHVSGAGAGQAGGCAQRPLLVRPGALRDADGPSCLRRGEPDQCHCRHSRARGAIGGGRGAAGGRSRVAEVPREGSERAMAGRAGYSSRASIWWTTRRPARSHYVPLADAGLRVARRVRHGVGARRGALGDVAATAGHRRRLSFHLTPPPGAEFQFSPNGGGSAISPDGQSVAFVAVTNGTPRLWIRALDSLTARELQDTDGARLPFWSPDSRVARLFHERRLAANRRVGSGAAPSSLAHPIQGAARGTPTGRLCSAPLRWSPLPGERLRRNAYTADRTDDG